MNSSNTTICAPATAIGGAITIIRLSGPDAISIVSTLCPPRSFFSVDGGSAVVSHTTHFTRIHDGSKIIDDTLITVFRAPHSYTGEDSVEISCHGSRYIVNKVLELLCQHGCRMAEPGEFTRRAYLNGKLDLTQAEAVADLIASDNKATHHIAMSQLRGGISTRLAELREQLLHLTSLIELELDFSDHEDIEFADRSELINLTNELTEHITKLANSFETGNALKNGIPVAIVGAPNVGKSTLLNALLGEERAIVSDIQGTTRDTIEDTININGITFRFIDTAGIRHTDDHIETLGIERSLSAVRRARIIIAMTEPGVPYPVLDIHEGQTVFRIENKTDAFQAKYGVGLDKLRGQLLTAVPQMSDSDVVLTNARHYDALQRSLEHLARVTTGISKNLPGDLIAEDLRLTLSELASITGCEITPQETLDNIFSHFCVGK